MAIHKTEAERLVAAEVVESLRQIVPRIESIDTFKTILNRMCERKMMEAVEAQFIADADDPAPVIVETGE